LKKFLLSTQLFFAGAFLASFIASFFIVNKIMADSRVIITQKIAKSISSQINIIEELLNTKSSKNILEENQMEAIRVEIAAFRKNPEEYVSTMTMQKSGPVVLPNELTSQNPIKNALIKKTLSWKQSIKAHFDRSFDGLLFDIRLFLLSNIIGLLIAAFIAWQKEKLGKHALVASLILTGVIVFSSFSYINSNWFYNILLNRYAGIAYPLGILTVSFSLYYDYLKTQNKARG